MRWPWWTLRHVARPVDWFGQHLGAVSRRRTDCLHPVWWRRIRWELAITLWGGWAVLIACGLAGLTFLVSASMYRQEQNHRIDQVVQEARDIRHDLVALLCRTSPSECPSEGPGGRRYEAKSRPVQPGPEGH